MMPQLLTVRVQRPEHRPIRIWIPVLPVALVLSPVLVLVALGAAIAGLIYEVRVAHAFGTGWRLFRALPGTRLDVREGRTAVRVSIW